MTRERARFFADAWPGFLSLPTAEQEEIVTRCILAAVAEATADERKRVASLIIDEMTRGEDGGPSIGSTGLVDAHRIIAAIENDPTNAE